MKLADDITQIAKSDLAKNSAKLLSANVIAQAIGLLVYPFLTRIYTSEDFGTFNLFLSIANIITLLATAEYQYAIVLPKDDRKATALFHIGLLITILICIVATVATVFSKSIATLFSTPRLADYFWLM